MFKTLRNAFKIKDLRKKLLYTFMMLVIIRIGCQLPIPGIDTTAIKGALENMFGDSFNMLNTLTGGSFETMSIFALNVSPYITASIIVQLLTIAIPALEEMQRDGEDGRKKLAEITRYLTVGLAVLEGLGTSIGFGRMGYLGENNAMTIATMVITLTAGSALVMWIGEQITMKGVGNGISIILMINIISRMPGDLGDLYQKFVKDKAIGPAVLSAAIILVIMVVTIVLVVLLQDAERRIPVQYSGKMQGRRTVGGQSTHIPLKVNTANVIPIIFASSIMTLPQIVTQLFNKTATGFWAKVFTSLSSNSWFDMAHPKRNIGLLIYIVLVVFFAYFYTSITFNPIEVANNMKKSGGFIPGIRPGKPTQDHLTKILNYIIFIGAVGLVIVAIIPIFFSGVFGANVSFGGTSLIIVVGVILETLKMIESQMLVRHYKGFLND